MGQEGRPVDEQKERYKDCNDHGHQQNRQKPDLPLVQCQLNSLPHGLT